VATSRYATSVVIAEDKDEVKAKAKPKLAANGRYVTISKSVIRSEEGGNDKTGARIVQDKPETQSTSTESTRTLYDYPRDPSTTSRIEVYRQAHPAEVSAPKEFMAYARDAIPTPERRTRPKITLPTVEESTEALHALTTTTKDETPGPTVLHRPLGDGKAPLTEEDIPRLRQQWYDEFKDILQGTPNELPPLREVNHEINLIDPDRKYTHRLPMCPVPLRTEFYSKLNRYVNAGWWKEHPASQAAPLMCIPKKDGRLRTVIDARQRNDNTVKDVTPLPDQDAIREDVARAKYRSKIDLADAYEQVRVEPRDVSKTVFSTILGTYVSNVVQQGDCNAPATFQRLMTSIFRDVVGRSNHAYLDDVFTFSGKIEDHERDLRIVFTRLRENKLFLKWSKCDLYAKEMDCLGHIIDDNGIHPDVDKLQRIRDWRVPWNYHDIQ
jgi:hypothetical protein